MSRSESKRTLHVTSEGGVRITVFDQQLRRVAEATHVLKKDLPIGLYEVRFEAGTSVQDEHVSLRPGSGAKRVKQPPIAFASSAPLEGTRAAVPEQLDAATMISGKVTRSLGTGGELMVFVRDRDLRARTSPAHGLTLLGRDDETIGEIERDGERAAEHDAEHPPWAGCTYELPAGSYRLRGPADAGHSVEQLVYVSPGWQTQVFLQRRSSRAGRPRRANLADASVLMGPVGKPFDPEDDSLRSAELARQGLRDYRTVVPTSTLEALVFKKRDNPMLAIYGAHLLLREKRPNRELIKTVADNLLDLIGPHPDVRALYVWLKEPVAAGAFSEPPMLKSSWSLVVAGSARHPELVPRGSRSANVAERVLAAGPWLRWRTEGAARKLDRPVASGEQAPPLAETLAEVAGKLAARSEWPAIDDPRISFAESRIVLLAREVRGQSGPASDADVVRALGVPRTVAEDAMNTVAHRFLY
jgi:hypothetical protein